MSQQNNCETTLTGENVEPIDIAEPEDANLSEVERAHLRLRQGLEEGRIFLEIKPNKAMKWLIERTISDNLLFKGLLVFNYIQWVILLPGVVALYFFEWYIGLAVFALCLAVAVLVVDKIKRNVLRGGVREFVIKDLVSLEALYSIGAVRFRRVPKGRWIRHPQDWQEVL
jgi:hypothetical protein